MIQIQNLRFSYGKQLLFENLDWSLSPGKIHGLIGRNGVGKSTLLRLLHGLLRADEGNLLVHGWQPANRSLSFLGNIYYLPEQVSINLRRKSWLHQNYGKLFPNYQEDVFLENLEAFEIDITTPYRSLSYGQKKLWLIAWVFALQVKVLLLDEPTNGLDPISQKVFKKLLFQQIQADRTIVISTHHLDALPYYVDTISLLKEGRIGLQTTPSELEDRLHFGITASPPESQIGSIFYQQRGLGGYRFITSEPPLQSIPMDLNLFFEAIQNSKELLDYLNQPKPITYG